MVGLYGGAAGFGLMWDVADLPTREIADVASVVSEEGRITAESWKGLVLYSHPRRHHADPGRVEQIQAVLQEFPGIARMAS